MARLRRRRPTPDRVLPHVSRLRRARLRADTAKVAVTFSAGPGAAGRMSVSDERSTMASEPTIHRYPVEHEGAFVNAYLVETEPSVVAVDALAKLPDSRGMRAGLEPLGKPLRAVLLTPSRPDHYGGLTQLVAGDDVPVIALQGVIDTIARDDEMKEKILRPM